MIPDSVITALRTHLEEYRSLGYDQKLVYEKRTNKYEVRIGKGKKSVVIRQGYSQGKPDRKVTELTSFDVLFQVGGVLFLKYVSDYPLEEYSKRLNEAFAFVSAFFANNYTISSERYAFFWKKKYLNLRVGGETEHLLECKIEATAMGT